VFPAAIDAPPLVPEEVDQEAPVPAEEVALAIERCDARDAKFAKTPQ
jgi:hypothetical protein